MHQPFATYSAPQTAPAQFISHAPQALPLPSGQFIVAHVNASGDVTPIDRPITGGRPGSYRHGRTGRIINATMFRSLADAEAAARLIAHGKA